MTMQGPLRIGIGGPVGAGKTTLTEMLCKDLSGRLSMAVITNDIYTSEDAEYLMKKQVLPLERIKGVETGGCPHTAKREDASINLAAIDEMNKRAKKKKWNKDNRIKLSIVKESMLPKYLIDNNEKYSSWFDLQD